MNKCLDNGWRMSYNGHIEEKENNSPLPRQMIDANKTLTETLTDEDITRLRGEISTKLGGKNIPSKTKVMTWANDPNKSIADHAQGHIDWWLDYRAKRNATIDNIEV